jgi:hypothetical protein
MMFKMNVIAYFRRMAKGHPTGTVRADTQVPNDCVAFFGNQYRVFVRIMGLEPDFTVIDADRRDVSGFPAGSDCLIIYLDYCFEVFQFCNSYIHLLSFLC